VTFIRDVCSGRASSGVQAMVASRWVGIDSFAAGSVLFAIIVINLLCRRLASISDSR